jgi:hypothetical protein
MLTCKGMVYYRSGSVCTMEGHEICQLMANGLKFDKCSEYGQSVILSHCSRVISNGVTKFSQLLIFQMPSFYGISWSYIVI